jgi:hypothetical protein
MNELHFAYKVRQHLNRVCATLPVETIGRLEMIRQRALAQQKVSVHQSVLAGAGSFVHASPRSPGLQATIAGA